MSIQSRKAQSDRAATATCVGPPLPELRSMCGGTATLRCHDDAFPLTTLSSRRTRLFPCTPPPNLHGSPRAAGLAAVRYAGALDDGRIPARRTRAPPKSPDPRPAPRPPAVRYDLVVYVAASVGPAGAPAAWPALPSAELRACCCSTRRADNLTNVR